MTTTIPAGYKLVPIEPNEAMLDAGCKQHRCEQCDPWYQSNDLGEGDCRDIYAAMLNAAPAAPGVSTVEDAGAQKIVIDFDQVGSAGPFHVIDGRVTIPAITVMDLVRMAAPAAGDAQELLGALKEARRELDACQAVIHLAGGFDPAYVRDAQAAIKRADAAIAAQRKGDV